jgi:hypothetical protein
MYAIQTQFYGHWTTKAHRRHAEDARQRAIRLLRECVSRRGDTRSVRVVRVPVR